MQRYKLVFFTPRTSTQTVLQHLFARFPNHVGRIGAYGGCAFVSPGTGQFRPLEGARPAIGQVGKPEHVEEDRVEVLVVLGASPARVVSSDIDCAERHGAHAAGADDADASVEMNAVLQELKEVHPYEEVAYDVYRLEDF
ncbi:hypothetical protein C8Q80DRAFT_1095793 [Daedaleopsis nitida]|nr:hypothetical protein C8Q80DRAFT_1095793 [Daedaleopsis nitida]